jgi:hypothetical protein
MRKIDLTLDETHDKSLRGLVAELSSSLVPDGWAIIKTENGDPTERWSLAKLPVLATLSQAIQDEIDMHAIAAAKGATWQEIGDALGISRQAAHKRYGQFSPATG